ncbi:hypothetical protein FWG86_02635 [Candidatus Saccharibacteria bacterium]|nr:hypothetical protein [Candidatus Saccharibacteria bacterium]
MRKGKITPNGVVLEKHENATVVFLTELGHDIELVRPRPAEHIKTPDIKLKGRYWEIKCPKGAGKYTIEHLMQAANKQAENLIIDLRRTKAPARSLAKIEREAKYRKGLKRIIVITKDRQVLDIKGSF